MNHVNASKRFSRPLASGALLGVIALAVGGGCNSQSSELQAMDAKALAAPPPPKPPMPGQRVAGMMPGSMPPSMQTGAAPSNAAPPPATLPPVNPPSATLPVAPPPAKLPPFVAPAATAIPAAPPAAPYDDSGATEKPKLSMVLATPAGSPPVLVPGTPSLKAQLKRLWNRGAAAKHRGDLAGARRAWLTARRLAPQWPGFQESLDKLKS